MSIVRSITGLTAPGVYSLEVAPEVIISGVQTSTIALLGTATKGLLTDTAPFASYDQNYIRAFGPIYATGNKANTSNYYSMPLGVLAISSEGGGSIYPIRIGDPTIVASATANVPGLTSGSFSIEAKTPGTYFNGAVIKVSTDILNPAQKKIIITTLFGDEEEFAAVDNWLDEINSSSEIIHIVSNTSTDALPANTTGITLSGGLDGVVLGTEVDPSAYIGAINPDGTCTGLELVGTMPNIRFIVLSEHYAHITDSTGAKAPTLTFATGGFLDPVSIKAIEVASNIGATVILCADSTLSYTQLKNLCQLPALKGTDRVVLTYPKNKFYEATYKTFIDISYAPFYCGKWASLNPNESPSNKALRGGSGPNKKIPVPQRKDMCDISFGLSAVSDIPVGGVGAINGQNTSGNGGLNQALRRRMADFILLSIDRQLGDLVSALNTETLRSSAKLRLDTFLSGLARDGLIGDSNGGPAYLIQISEANNSKASVTARRLNISIVVSLFTPADFIICKGTIGFGSVSLSSN